jgi:hypothetical protein
MKFRITLISILLTSLCMAQVNVRDSLLKVPMVIPFAGVGLPLQDLNKRFGEFGVAGASFLWKTKKNWVWGVDGTFLFGSLVKEDSVLKAVSVGDNFLIGADGTLYDIRLQMRGMQWSARFGKLIPLGKPNKNSGLLLTMGAGLLQHRIRFDFERNADIPPIADGYQKGYDRLSNGLSLNPSVAYVHLSNNRLLNFFFALDYSLAFTQNRRSWNFDLEGPDNLTRTDGALWIRAGWIVPLYERVPPEFYYY